MTAFRDAVAAWNARFRDQGWRQASADVWCPQCQAARVVWVTTIGGQTRAGCQTCHTTWIVET